MANRCYHPKHLYVGVDLIDDSPYWCELVARNLPYWGDTIYRRTNWQKARTLKKHEVIYLTPLCEHCKENKEVSWDYEPPYLCDEIRPMPEITCERYPTPYRRIGVVEYGVYV